MKESGKSSQVHHLRESRCAVPFPQWGRLRYENAAFLALSERIYVYVKKNNDGQSLPRVGKVASEASRIGHWRYEREQEDRLKSIVYENVAARSPFPNGEGKEDGASPQKRKPTPPRYARQPLPREGARVDAPSLGRRCPEGAEIGWGKRYEREREIVSSASFTRTPERRCAVPLPQGGSLRYENTAFLALSERIHAYVEKE